MNLNTGALLTVLVPVLIATAALLGDWLLGCLVAARHGDFDVHVAPRQLETLIVKSVGGLGLLATLQTVTANILATGVGQTALAAAAGTLTSAVVAAAAVVTARAVADIKEKVGALLAP